MTSNSRFHIPNRVSINLDNALHNLRVIAGRLKPGVSIMPVVKSDAYGHGLAETSHILEQEKEVWGFGISTADEARILREAGITKRLFLLSGCFPQEASALKELDLSVGAVSMEMLDVLQSHARRYGFRQKVHLKVDTGMGRYGVLPEEAVAIASGLSRWPDIILEGLYTHMPVADDQSDSFNQAQIELFTRLVSRVQAAGWKPRYIHMANSAAVMNFPASHFNLVRPGIAVYGSLPGVSGSHSHLLKGVMSFESTIQTVRYLRAGTPVGYGHTARLNNNSLVAVVPAGYDDGYMRSLSSRGIVMVKGERCPVLGRICMRAMMVDVSAVDRPAPGDRVLLFGSAGGDSLPVDEIARLADTISYELLCLVGTRNRRIFKQTILR